MNRYLVRQNVGRELGDWWVPNCAVDRVLRVDVCVCLLTCVLFALGFSRRPSCITPSRAHTPAAGSGSVFYGVSFLPRQAQFGYTCAETFTGLIAWVAYWVYPFFVMLFHMRMMCFRYLCAPVHLTIPRPSTNRPLPPANARHCILFVPFKPRPRAHVLCMYYVV